MMKLIGMWAVSLIAVSFCLTSHAAEGMQVTRAEKLIERCPNGVEKLPMPQWAFFDKKGVPLKADKKTDKFKLKVEEYRCPDIKESRKKNKKSS